MASRTITTRTDDIDGTEGATSVRFSLDGVHYEIDLSEQHAGDLREALGLYTAHGRRLSAAEASGASRGRRASSSRSTGAAGSGSAGGYDVKAVRAWAAANDIDVPPRGRIPNTVIEAYRQANPTSA